jgi:serine/threonine protein kinase
MVAIKLERHKTYNPQLEYEYKLYEKFAGIQGFSKIYWYGVEGDFNVLVMDMMGPSIHDLFVFCESKFTLKTITWIGLQMLTRIESMHKLNFIHRDIKPENFLIGNSKKIDRIYCIDFGLSKRFICPKTNEHCKYKKTKFIGTPRYASLNAHKGYE